MARASDEVTLPVHPEPQAGGPPNRREQWRRREAKLGGFMRLLTRLGDFRRQPGVAVAPTLGQMEAWCREALDKRGKMAGLVAIAHVADAFRALDPAGRDAFYHVLRNRFAADRQAVDGAIAAYTIQPDDPRTLVQLMNALRSPRVELWQLFNTIPQGIKFLVDLRAHLLSRLKAEPELLLLEEELRELLESYFNLGFLQLERITWDSSAALLERLIDYEAVHRISTWRDLKHRLISDRACFAFLHPAMPSEPVIFVEVALVQGLADSVQRLLDPDAPDLRPEEADTAIFYGISNAQRGLRGIPFGNLLIKQVVGRLRGEVPNLRTFATLSPLPRFRQDFLDPALVDGTIEAFFKQREAEHLCAVARAPSVGRALQAWLDSERGLDMDAEAEGSGWLQQSAIAEAARPGLLRAVRHYITERRHEGHAACPVAHFHGANGALLARINWLADTSTQGRLQSAGIMVNYRYDMQAFEQRQASYLTDGRVAMDEGVRAL